MYKIGILSLAILFLLQQSLCAANDINPITLLDSNAESGRYLVFGPSPFQPRTALPKRTAAEQFGNFSAALVKSLNFKLSVNTTYISFASLWSTLPSLANNATTIAADTAGNTFVTANPAKCRKWTWNMMGEAIPYTGTFADATDDELMRQALARNLELWEDDSLWNRTSVLRAWLSAPASLPVCGSANGSTAEVLYLHCGYGQDPLLCGVGLLGTYQLRFFSNYSSPEAQSALLQSTAPGWVPLFNESMAQNSGVQNLLKPYLESLYWTHAYVRHLVETNQLLVISSHLPGAISVETLEQQLTQSNPSETTGYGDSDGVEYVDDPTKNSNEELALLLAHYYAELLPSCPIAEDIDDAGVSKTVSVRVPWLGAFCFLVFVAHTMTWAYNAALMDQVRLDAEKRLKALESQSLNPSQSDSNDATLLSKSPYINTQSKAL